MTLPGDSELEAQVADEGDSVTFRAVPDKEEEGKHSEQEEGKHSEQDGAADGSCQSKVAAADEQEFEEAEILSVSSGLDGCSKHGCILL